MRIAILFLAVFLLPGLAAAQQPTSSDMGSGASWFDHDQDGDIDLLFLTPTGGIRLFENEDGKFTEITDTAIPAGIQAVGIAGLGISCGDLNNDNYPDVFLTMNGTNFLLLNEKNGTFSAAGRKAGIFGEHMSASNVVFDYDNDKLLDIYIANYMGLPNQLFHCTGVDASGIPHYEEVAEDLGLDFAANGQSNWGLGVLVGDFDDDGDVDLYVGNDYNGPGDGVLNPGDNIYYRNNGDGTFTDATDAAGLREHGWAMGVAEGDYDNDGDFDIFVANFWEDGFYRNNGDGTFTDFVEEVGLITGGQSEWHYNGWGASFLDYDNDGDLDIHVANGFIPNDQDQVEDEPDQLWENLGPNAGYLFQEIGRESGVNRNLGDSRGAAYGDFNRDGLIDILIVNNDYVGDGTDPKTHPARVMYVNRGDGTYRDEAFSLGFREDFADGNAVPGYKNISGNRWVQIQPMGTLSNVSAVGAKVMVEAGGKTWYRQVSGQSYCSQNSPYLHFGLGPVDLIDRITIRFPSGTTRTWEDVAVDQILTLVEPGVPVRLLSFGLHSGDDGVRVRWEWTDDDDAAGFRITRRFGGVEETVVPFLRAENGHGEWTDHDAPAGQMVYSLYAIHRDGTSERLMSQAVAHGHARPVRLGAAFPNPVRGSASIPVMAPDNRIVTVDILDVTGRVVRTLSEPVAAGESHLRWDRRNGAGHEVAAGTYFYRLRGSDAQAGKITVRP